MSKKPRIVFWQPMPSPHQSAYISALARRLGGAAVLCVFETSLDDARLDMGWQQPSFGAADVVIGPAPDALNRLFEEAKPPAINIVAGIAGWGWSREVFNQLNLRRSRVALLSEGRDYKGILGALRVAHGQFVERRYRNRAAFVLAMGKTGRNWFRFCGYRDTQIFSFPYVVENNDAPWRHEENSEDEYRIIVVAQLIKRKRIDLLISALGRLQGFRWKCSVIGDGPERRHLQELTAKHGLEGRIWFKGAMPNTKAREEIAQTDLLVLPSRFDGWGAVVNEALMEGTPALVSDYCGAAELIHPGFNGDLFRNRSLTSLEQKLRGALEKGKVSLDDRARIKQWSKAIQGEAIAEYLLRIVDFIDDPDKVERPIPPWLRPANQHLE